MTQRVRVAVSRPTYVGKLPYRRAMPGDAHVMRNRLFHLFSYTAPQGWAPHAPAPLVELIDGTLYIDGVRVVSPSITADHISWRQQARDSHGAHFTSGILHFKANGIEAHGSVCVGNTPHDAQSHDVFATAVPPDLHYSTRISAQPQPAGTQPDQVHDWNKGLALSIGYRQQIGSAVPQPVVFLGDQDISALSTWTTDGDDTVLVVVLDDASCSFAGDNFYKAAKIAFNALAINPTGNGSVQATCGTAAPAGQTWLWQADPLVTAASRRATARREFKASDLLALDDAPLAITDLITILPDDVVSDDANSMLMRNMKWAMGQNSDESKWLQQFFGETPPVITEPGQVALVNKSLGWYQDKFAMAYLTQSFNSYDGPNAPSTRLNSSQADWLTTYLKSGLAKEGDFAVQHKGIYVDAYRGTKPRLQDYLNDTTSEYVGYAQGSVVFSCAAAASADITIDIGTTIQTASGVVYTTQSSATIKAGTTQTDAVTVSAQLAGQDSVVGAGTLTVPGPDAPKGLTVTNAAATTLSADTGGLKWAKKLFSTLTTGSQFTLMVNRVAGAAGDPKALGPVNNFACLLTVLDPSGAIANDYFNSVLSGVLMKFVPDVMHLDKATILQWLPTAMQELLRKLADGELPNETDISKEEAQAMYAEYLAHASEVTSLVADLLTAAFSGGLIGQARAAEEAVATAFASQFPKLAKAARFMFALGWIGAVASVIVSLTKGDWAKMDDVEKAEFVTQIVQLSVTGFEAVPLIWQGTKSITLSVWNTLKDWWNKPAQQDEVNDQMQAAVGEEEPLLPAAAENVGTIIGRAGALGEGTIFERIFAEGVFTGVLKCLGAITAVAMAGYSVWQLAKDVMAGKPVETIVFDSLIMSATVLSAVCVVADLFVATTFLPIAGPVLAIVGIVLAIIAGFVEKPDNPVEDWMHDHGVGFANSLAPQAA